MQTSERDAPSRDTSLDELHLYVTEESNPRNQREVARVDVRVLARWDLSERLDQLRRSFEQALRAEVTNTVDGVLQALERAQQQRAMLADDVAEHERDRTALHMTIAAIRSALSTGRPGGGPAPLPLMV